MKGEIAMKRNELDIIKQAILNEIEGFEFYKMADKQAASRESQEAFNELAEEEFKHAEYLRELFDQIKDGKEDDITLSFLSEVPSPKIFDWDRIDNKSSSLALSVFGIGVQMEKASIDFYEDAKKNTAYETARKLFDILIHWENVHLEQFTTQYNRYKEEWWNDQGYAPF